MTAMPSSSGSSSRRERSRARPGRPSISPVATPEMTNSKPMRQGLLSRISGSSAG